MKFEVDRDVFAATLSSAKGAVSKTSNMPILQNVMLRPEGDGRIEVTATDLELSIRLFMEARVTDPGSSGITFPAKVALDIVRSFSEARLSVVLRSDHKVEISAGKSRRALPSIDFTDFPMVPSRDEADFVQCDRTALMRALGSTLYAVPPESDAYSLPGVCVYRIEPEKYRFAASDGHRVAFFDIPEAALAGITIGEGIVIPYPAINEILKLLEREGPVHIAVEDGRLWLRAADAVFSTQLLVSERPDFECLLQDRTCSLSVDAEVLKNRLKSMLVLCSRKDQPAELKVANGLMALRLYGEARGEADDEIPVEYDGEDDVLHINMRYLADAVGVFGAGMIRIEWIDGMHPIILIRPEDRAALHWVMPVCV